MYKEDSQAKLFILLKFTHVYEHIKTLIFACLPCYFSNEIEFQREHEYIKLTVIDMDTGKIKFKNEGLETLFNWPTSLLHF